ncbi:MAG: hypothetical protein A2Y10_05265 [Planctomycetes bacterium GWF2_41_51]|nr:MAG: hypothetical protein A2Y10_05265 [Planctomycetes bacterium GWF2_41_51]HBG25527.1 hypothetical protein [Phycisphaerales bacterium]
MAEIYENTPEMREEKAYLWGYVSVGILCAVAVVLSIIGLANYSLLASAVAVIMLAIVFLLEGGTMVRFFQMSNRKRESGMQTVELSAEVIGGVAGLVLGILALIGYIPVTLIAIAAIIYGAALILGSAFAPTLSSAGAGVDRQSTFEILIGVAGLTLGILAILDINPLVLSLIAIIILSLGAFMTETTLKNKVSRLYLHK